MRKGRRPGEFMPGSSLVHRLNPSVKVGACLVTLASILVSSWWPVIAAAIILLAAGFNLAGIKYKLLWRGTRALIFLLTITFVLQSLLTPGHALFRWTGDIAPTSEGVVLGTKTVLRLITIYWSSLLLTATTSPTQLANGLETILLPLGKLRLPVHQISMLVAISLRFIPDIIEEAAMIGEAQRSRGAPLDSPRLIERLPSQLSILIPVLASTLQRASDLALAMESRCYTGQQATRFTNQRWSLRDFITISLYALLFIVALRSHYR